MSSATDTTSTTGGPHSAERFSGLETEEMKLAGSSLLFPSDSDFEFELTAFENEAGSPFPGKEGFVLTFQAHSKSSKTLPAPCAVGGLCNLTEACLKSFTEIYLPAKEQRKLGIEAPPEMKWPGVHAFWTCPKCSAKSKVGGSYYLIFYSILQVQVQATSSAVPFAHAHAARVGLRFMCTNCMFDICQGNKIPKNLERVGLEPDMTVFEILGYGNVPVFFPGGKMASSQNEDELLTAWHLYYGTLRRSYVPALEAAFCQEIGLIGGEPLFKEMMAARGISAPCEQQQQQQTLDPKEVKKRAKDMNEAGICFVCRKENSKNKCSRCKTVSYCGTGCQRKDWKRHKMVECIPPDPK
jgi:hypothetical protein